MKRAWIVIFDTLGGVRSESFDQDHQADCFADRVNGRVVPMVQQADGTWVVDTEAG